MSSGSGWSPFIPLQFLSLHQVQIQPPPPLRTSAKALTQPMSHTIHPSCCVAVAFSTSCRHPGFLHSYHCCWKATYWCHVLFILAVWLLALSQVTQPRAAEAWPSSSHCDTQAHQGMPLFPSKVTLRNTTSEGCISSVISSSVSASQASASSSTWMALQFCSTH